MLPVCHQGRSTVPTWPTPNVGLARRVSIACCSVRMRYSAVAGTRVRFSTRKATAPSGVTICSKSSATAPTAASSSHLLRAARTRRSQTIISIWIRMASSGAEESDAKVVRKTTAVQKIRRSGSCRKM